MMNKDKAIRDIIALSLGGVTTVAAYSAMPAISFDRLRQDQASNAGKPRALNWRVWMPRRFRVV